MHCLTQDDWEPQAHEEAVDMLQLAFNGSSGATAALVATRLLHLITDEAGVRDLLQTAVIRAHHEVLRQGARQFTAQRVPPSSVLHLMQTAAETCPQPLWQPPAALAAEQFQHGMSWRMRMAAQLVIVVPPPAVEREPLFEDLLPLVPLGGSHPQEPTRAWPIRCSVMHWLVKLPAARSVLRDALQQVTQTVLLNGCSASVRALCALPVLQQVDTAGCSSLLESAISHNQGTAVVALCSLPAAGRVHLAVLLKTLQALRTGDAAAATAVKLAVLITVARILRQQEHAVAAFLQAARSAPSGAENSRAASTAISRALDILSAAAPVGAVADDNQQGTQAQFWQFSNKVHRLEQMSRDQLLQLLSNLVMHCSNPTTNSLHWLRTASEVPMDATYQALRGVVRQRNLELLCELRRLPLSTEFDSDAVCQLLTDSADSDAADSVDIRIQKHLCKMPGAAQISSVQLVAVISALVAGKSTMTEDLCNLPAARDLTTELVADLLQSAVQQQDGRNVSMICLHLQQSHRIGSDMMTEMIHAAVSDSQYAICTTLCQLASTANIQVKQVDLMLEKALEVGNGDVVRTLCQLPLAKTLKPAFLMEQLLQAIKSDSAVAVYSLCQLPAVADTYLNDRSMVLRLLQTAVQLKRSSVIACLGQLSAVRMLPADVFAELIHTAEQQGDQQMVRAVKRVAAMAKDGFDQ